jgi:hypothetical protein
MPTAIVATKLQSTISKLQKTLLTCIVPDAKITGITNASRSEKCVSDCQSYHSRAHDEAGIANENRFE